MDKEIKKLIACPKCKKSRIKISNDKIACSKCKSNYKIENGVPIFIESIVENADNAKESFRRKIIRKGPKAYRSFNKIYRFLGPPGSVYAKSKKIENAKITNPLLRILKKGQTRLNIGASRKKNYRGTINLDIGAFEGVNIVADGKNLPFKNNSFDLVIIESVLEHIDEPEKVIEESARVLKKGGRIHISIPFVFGFHGSPNDFNRYTLVGLVKRLKNNGFEIEEAGILSGPGSTISQMLRYYLALLFSFNNDFLFSLMLNIFGWLTFPLKYTDILLNKYKKAHMISNVIYATGIKK